MEDKIAVMVIDKQALFRAGVRQALTQQGDLEVLDGDPDENAMTLIENHAPDVVLLDIDYPSLNGLGLGRKIAARYPLTRVVLLSSDPDDQQLFEAIKSGLVAYLNKDCSTEQLIDTIKQAYNGEYPINESLTTQPKIAEHILKQFQSLASMGKALETIAAPLTPREIEILNYIASGNSNKQIANILSISEQTIKNHVSAILRKLNANDRAHAVVMAIRHGWISTEEA